MIILLMLSEVSNMHICGAFANVLGFVMVHRYGSVMGMKHRRLVRARSAPVNRNAPSCVCNGCSILVFLCVRLYVHTCNVCTSTLISNFVSIQANLGYLFDRTSFYYLVFCNANEFYCRIFCFIECFEIV